jgi:hypothetical protein
MTTTFLDDYLTEAEMAAVTPVLAERHALLQELDWHRTSDPGDRIALWREVEAINAEVEERYPVLRPQPGFRRWPWAVPIPR